MSDPYDTAAHPPLTPPSTREMLLRQAISHTCGDRDVEYGSPASNLAQIADLWSAYLKFNVTNEDVAWMNVLQKCARSTSGRAGADTYSDAAAYAAIAGELNDLG